MPMNGRISWMLSYVLMLILTRLLIPSTGDEEMAFTGAIAGKYPITMKLKISDTSIGGVYFYDKYRKEIRLDGTIGRDGQFVLNEQAPDGKITGSFSGSYVEGKSLAGKWSNADGSKTMPFALKRADAQDVGLNKKEKSTHQLLQGKWRSCDDPKAIIEFKGDLMIDYYDGEELSIEGFKLGKSCPGYENSVASDGEESCLIAGDFCWYIDYLDGKSLTLIYSSKGNFLNYEKQN